MDVKSSVFVFLLIRSVAGFVVPPAQCKTVASGSGLQAYVPSGLTPEEWKKLKAKEEADRKKKNFGKGGARGFESRSMQSFVAALEKGEAKHLMPVNPSKVRSGEIALKDVPYMQRGGSWDNKDLKGNKGWMNTGFGMKAFNDGKAKTLKKNKYDDKYNKLKPSTNFWGTQVGVDWTGKSEEALSKRAKKNGISNDMQMWRDAGALSPEEARKRKGGAPKLQAGNNAPEKKFFGLF